MRVTLATVAGLLVGMAWLMAQGHEPPAPSASRLRDGALLAEQPCTIASPSYDAYVAALKARPAADPKDAPFVEAAFRKDFPAEWFDALKRGDRVRCRRITYASDGLRVTGFIVEPIAAGGGARHPAIVFNRGGSIAFGAIRTGDLMECAGWALDGYVVVASQYRGNDGGEGAEEFGGADVADVLNLITLARALPSVDPDQLFMYGLSRGGMMTYLALKAGAPVRAAAVIGGPTDLADGLRHRPEMEEVYRELMPQYASRRDELLRARSAVEWTDRLTVPLLILHGGADWRVWPGDALAVAQKLQSLGRPYELVIYAGDDHPLTNHRADASARMRAWFSQHAR